MADTKAKAQANTKSQTQGLGGGKAQMLIKRFNDLKGRRANWDSHWLDIANYYIPEYDDVFGTRTAGEKKRYKIYESTGPHSLVLLSAALHGMLTNPAAPWFGLSTGDDKLDNDDSVRQWLQDCSVRINDILNASNFQQEIHETYMGLGSFGTSILAIEEDAERIVRFQSRPIYQSYIAENSKGLVDTVFRTFKWTLRQIKDEFGEDALPDSLKEARNIDEEFEVIHAVYPRSDQEYILDNPSPLKMKFASCYVLVVKAHILKESGFNDLPYVVPRWMKVAGETYGRSPAMIALPDTKMVNEMMKTTIRGAQKQVDPPLLLPDEGIMMPFRATPSALNYYRAGSTDKIEPLKTDGRVDFGFQMMEDVRKRIREAFFIDQLQLQNGPQMTAEEVRERADGQLRLLGPVLARQQFELLRPLIGRVMNIAGKRNMLPQNMPASLKGRILRVQYTSQIARTQRMSEMETLGRALQLTGPVAQADPTVLDNLNGDEYFRYAVKLAGLPQQLIRKQADRDNVRKARAKQIQDQQQQQKDLNDSQQAKNVLPGAAAVMKAKQQGNGTGGMAQ